MEFTKDLHQIKVYKGWITKCEPILITYQSEDSLYNVAHTILAELNMKSTDLPNLIISSINPSISELDITKTLNEQGINDESSLYVNIGQANIHIRTKDEFDILEKIGRGSNTITYYAIDKTNGNKVASQEITDQKGQIANKINLTSINFPSIIKLYGIIENSEDNSKISILLNQYASNGTLNEKLIGRRNVQPLNYTQKCIIMYGIAAGMKKLHEKGIIHYD